MVGRLLSFWEKTSFRLLLIESAFGIFQAPMLYLFEKHHDEPVYQPAAGATTSVSIFSLQQFTYIHILLLFDFLRKNE